MNRSTIKLTRLIANRNCAAEKVREANAAYAKTKWAITEWGSEQVQHALAEKGITPGKSIVRMRVRKRRKDQIVLEKTECLLEGIGRVDPPTMERGALGKGAVSTEMWWCAHINWRNIRKDGTPGATHDFCVVQGDTLADLVSVIEHVRDIDL